MLHHYKKTKKENSVLEKIMLFVAVGQPLMTIPQIIDLYSSPGDARVSIVTWALYIVASLLWLFYGVYNRNKPLALAGGMWVVMDTLVVAGVLLK